MPAHLELEALRALVSIVEQGGFSAAAERLGRTQSAISLQIKRLEQTLGQVLLHRVQGRVTGPTAEGEALLGYARSKGWLVVMVFSEGRGEWGLRG